MCFESRLIQYLKFLFAGDLTRAIVDLARPTHKKTLKNPSPGAKSGTGPLLKFLYSIGIPDTHIRHVRRKDVAGRKKTIKIKDSPAPVQYQGGPSRENYYREYNPRL